MEDLETSWGEAVIMAVVPAAAVVVAAISAEVSIYANIFLLILSTYWNI